jgi:DNA primase
MKKYSQTSIARVKAADIRLFIPSASTIKAKQEITCPFCGKRKMNVVYSPMQGKNFAYCFACQNSFSDPIKAVMHFSGLDWAKALERVAMEAGIVLSQEL